MIQNSKNSLLSKDCQKWNKQDTYYIGRHSCIFKNENIWRTYYILGWLDEQQTLQYSGMYLGIYCMYITAFAYNIPSSHSIEGALFVFI